MNLVEGADAVVELVKDVQEALAIVKAKAKRSLNLTLTKAELEIEISTQNVAKAGVKLELGISLEASIKRERSHKHVFSLVLEPTKEIARMGWEETHDLADSIIALAGIRNDVARLGFTDFKIGDLVLELHIEKKTSGGLQIACGGEGESGNTQKVTLYFREQR
jgi:hypothetical protein